MALPVMFGSTPPSSLLDVGCGTGTWIRAAVELGVRDVFGVDGVSIPRNQLLFEPARFHQQDLTVKWNLGRRFDAVLCLEVGEHLERRHAETLIETLAAHSDVVYFSAACPGQPGEHHVNCQWPEYWQHLFNQVGFSCSDHVRWALWDEHEVEPWYRQNMFIARRDAAEAGREPRIKAAIHPDLLRYLEAGYIKRHIETGEMRPGWYMSLPFRAAFHKLKRRLTSSTPMSGTAAATGPRT